MNAGSGKYHGLQFYADAQVPLGDLAKKDGAHKNKV